MCSKCREEKPISDFNPRGPQRPGQFQSQCKPCSLISSNAWRALRREELNLKRREEYAKTPEVRREDRRRWIRNNPERNRENQRLCKLNREHTDPAYKLAGRVRTRLGEALKKFNRSASSEQLLGCSWDQFLGHLEIQFSGDMCWDNYGRWHVDHVRPLATFDLSKPEEQRAAFHWTNHQPLWAKDNLKKGAKWQ